jgi:5S rRNA maturation endonuclease (ribonuclease M5)
MIYDVDKVIDVLTLDEILKHTTEYDIYSYYLGSKFEVGRIMSSPFRQDLKPSFGIFKNKDDTALLWKDQATGECGNVVTFVRKLRDLYHNKQALKLIWDEVVLNHIQYTERGKQVAELFKSAKTIISVKRRNFSETDNVYWDRYDIDRDTLKHFNVYPISFFWINDIQQSLIHSKEDPMYAYKIFDKFKIYRPLSKLKKDKWRTNCSFIDLQGYEQLPKTGKLLIITKSLKDVMVLYDLGYNAVALHSENDNLSKEVFSDLSKRFKRIIVFFDNDKPGLDASNKLCEKYNLQGVHIDSSLLTLYQVKDISDYIAVFPKGIKKYVQSLIRPIRDV